MADHGTVHIDAPTECPFHISGFTHIDYASTATVNAGSVVADQFVLTVSDWKVNVVSATVNTSWNTDGNPWTIAISGDYYAGQAGFDANNTGYDTMYDQFYYTSPGPNPQAIATVTMAYSYGSPDVSVLAPGRGLGRSVHSPRLDQ